jgi:hypothetical protein
LVANVLIAPLPPPKPQPPPRPRTVGRDVTVILGIVAVVFAIAAISIAVSAVSSAPAVQQQHSNPAAVEAAPPPSPPRTPAQLKQDAKDEAILLETARQAAAKVMENNLLGQGFNVDVNAIGLHHTTLRLKWILVSKVTAYQFSQQGDTLQGLKDMGFKKFTITDGYDESWTWTL